MLEPLLIARNEFEKLTPEQQKIVAEAGASLEKFGMEESRKDDQRMAEVYGKAGVAVHDMDEASFGKWRALAERSAFKDFAEKVKNGKALLDMALAVR